MSSVEKSLSYAALILADAEVEVSSDNLLTLLKNANIEADKIWADLYAKALDGKDLKEFFFNFSAAPAASAGGASGAGAASGDAAAAEEEAKEESAAEESDADMGFGLFD